MGNIDEYRAALSGEDHWDRYLAAHSGLPGPRANIELALAAAEDATPDRIRGWLEWDADRAPTNSQEEFLAFCGVVALGRLAVQGDEAALIALRRFASDPRWRVREGVAMALQRLGDADFDRLVRKMERWADGSCLEQRAAAAALCEPRLLSASDRTAAVLGLLDRITASMVERTPRGTDFRILRKGMGYCWSVAVAADPRSGIPAMERWVRTDDPDVKWVMRENLRKKRLGRLNAAWVKEQLAILDG